MPNETVARPSLLTDFPDHFSPMLVKELRQGMRTRGFAIAFIVVQAFMVFVGFFSSVTASFGGGTGLLDGVFWFVLVLFFVYLMPLRGFGALSNEIQSDTLETILLTRLSAWRIVVGKWLALVSQTTLLLTAVLPYVVLRYWLGTVNILADVFWLAVIFLSSVVLCAVTIGFSSQKSFIMRGALAVLIYAGVFALQTFIIDTYISHSGGYREVIPHATAESTWAYYLDWAILLAFTTYFTLDLGASAIAPEAANHSTRKRLLGIAASGLLLASWVLGVTYDFAITLGSLVLVLVCIDALTEPATLVRSVYEPFFGKGPPGRFAGLFLCPGWAHGVCLTLSCAGAIIAIWIAYRARYHGVDLEGWTISLGALGTLLFPLAFIRLFLRRATRTFTLYVIIQSISLGFAWLLWFINDGLHVEGVLWIGCLHPLVAALIPEVYSWPEAQSQCFWLVLGVTSLCLLILLAGVARHLKEVRKIMKDPLYQGREAERTLDSAEHDESVTPLQR